MNRFKMLLVLLTTVVSSIAQTEEGKEVLRNAQKGDAKEQYLLSQHYKYGWKGFPKNKKEELKWLRMAAESRNPEAQFTYARMYKYDTGKEYGIENNEEEYEKWMLRSAEGGCDLALYDLGIYYKDKDRDKSIYWFKRTMDACYKKNNAVDEFAEEHLQKLGVTYNPGEKIEAPKVTLERYLERWVADNPFPTLSEYVKPRVEGEINAWQQKKEFESTAKWKARVKDSNRNSKINALTAKYKKEYATKAEEYKAKHKAAVKSYYTMLENEKLKEVEIRGLYLSVYDADHESFMITGASDADILLSVKLDEAPGFKDNWETIKKTANFKYVPNNDDVALVSVSFTHGDKVYTYDGNSNIKYGVTDIQYNFRPLEIPLDGNINFTFDPLDTSGSSKVVSSVPNNQQQKVERTQLTVGNMSEVDKSIPTTQKVNDKTFAVIIGNENYQKVAKVEFANNDAYVFSQYCQKTLGMPEKNVRCYNDATYATMLSAIDDIKEIAEAFKGDMNVVFYYAGHGIPNVSSKDAFLLPVDTDGRNTEVCYPLNRLYKELSELNAKSVTVFMDACFSGTQRGEGMLDNARGVALKPKSAEPQGNMVIFTAASDDETAYPYKDKGHGLFTFFLLKKLQDTKGGTTLGELGKYIIDNVSQTSVVNNRKKQTPTVQASYATDNWKNLRLR